MSTRPYKSQYSHDYYLANRARRLEYGAEWRKNNKEKMQAARDGWLANHPEYIKQHYQLSKEQQKINHRKHYLKNKESIKAKELAKYHAMTPDERTLHNEKRRARHARQPEVRNRIERARDHSMRAGDRLTPSLWATIMEAFNNRCIYCGTTDKITIEHLTPISKGGLNTADNLRPACLSCNSSKRNKTYAEYMIWRSERVGALI